MFEWNFNIGSKPLALLIFSLLILFKIASHFWVKSYHFYSKYFYNFIMYKILDDKDNENCQLVLTAV